VAEVTNSAAVAFYEKLGVRRVTLPRHLALGEVRDIVQGSPGMKFDVFALYGQCANAEGLCTFSHDHPRRVWPCVQPYHISCSEKEEERGELAPAVCAQMLWDGLERGEACGLCALPDLEEAGIGSVKIVGRGTSTVRKEWAVSTIASLLRFLKEKNPGREEFCREARRRYGERFPRGCRPTLCYFPELAGASGE
jgi:putative protease